MIGLYSFPFTGWGFGQPFAFGPQTYDRFNNLNHIDRQGIACISTNAVTLSEDGTTVDYGISPCVWRQLPDVGLVLLNIHADVPAGGEALPVTVVIPNGGTSTVSAAGSTTGTTKVNVVDSQGTNLTGADITGNTQRFAYINKCTGIIRFLEYTATAA